MNGSCFANIRIDSETPSPTDVMEFCTGEDYLESEIHSPTDTSEDSVEVKVSPISLLTKRKRVETTFSGPLKKRMCLKVKAESRECHPFRPWSPSPATNATIKTEEVLPVPSPKPVPKKEFTPYFRPPSPPTVKLSQQTEAIALVKEKVKIEVDDVRVPIHPQISTLTTAETERLILKTNQIFPTLQQTNPMYTDACMDKKLDCQRKEQRNYKNMTRERRIEANARERTRVHTISAAFDTLRRSIPSYSHNQKLSKLSVLRIACSYIMTLSSIVSDDDNNTPSTSECVDMVSKTIQREGKLRKKKDDND